MASEHSISGYYSTVCRLSGLGAAGQVAMFSVLVSGWRVSIGDRWSENTVGEREESESPSGAVTLSHFAI